MGRVPSIPEGSAGPEDQAVANDYDSFAEAYSAETEANLINGYYTRPAILDLAGDVAGRWVLDVGCGSGPLFAALRNRGAIVTGIDKSAGMLKLGGRSGRRSRRSRGAGPAAGFPGGSWARRSPATRRARLPARCR